MEHGNIVVLNGTCSAGKTTTARALQEIMETPYVHSGIDPFLRRVPEQCFAVWEGADPPGLPWALDQW